MVVNDCIGHGGKKNFKKIHLQLFICNTVIQSDAASRPFSEQTFWTVRAGEVQVSIVTAAFHLDELLPGSWLLIILALSLPKLVSPVLFLL